MKTTGQRGLLTLALLFLLAGSAAAKAFLGVYPGKEVNLEARGHDGSGLMINDIVEDGPAEEAGLFAGDVLIRFGKMELQDNDDLGYFLRKHKKGDKVELTVFRDGKERKIDVILGARKSGKTNWNSDEFFGHWKEKKDKQGFLGVTTIELSDELLETWQVKEGYGILVNTVIEGSAAERDGVKAGDLIIELNGSPVYSSDRLGRLCRRNDPGTEVDLRLLRDGKMKTLKVTLGKRSDIDSWDFGMGEFPDLLDEMDFDFNIHFDEHTPGLIHIDPEAPEDVIILENGIHGQSGQTF